MIEQIVITQKSITRQNQKKQIIIGIQLSTQSNILLINKNNWK